jgi:hypothetical protein
VFLDAQSNIIRHVKLPLSRRVKMRHIFAIVSIYPKISQQHMHITQNKKSILRDSKTKSSDQMISSGFMEFTAIILDDWKLRSPWTM